MDLSTRYLGLELPNPLIAGASPLADDGRQGVLDLASLAGIVEDIGHGRRPAQTLVKLTDGQQPGVGSDQPAVGIGDDDFTGEEIEGKLFSTVCHAKASLPCWLRDSITRILQGFGGPCYAQPVNLRE